MLAFGIGNPVDWAIIFVVALIVFGPKKLPEIGQQLGQALREFRKIADDVTGVTDSVRSEVSGVATAFCRQVDDVRTAAVIDATPLLAERRDASPGAVSQKPAGESDAGERKPRGLRISTAVPEDREIPGNEKGQQ